MIRCSDVALALLLAGPAGAGPLISDAFGLFDPDADPDRAVWSGWTSAGPVTPGEPDHIVIHAGPKSLVAGKDPGHVVAIIVDRAGNLVADDTPATLTIADTRHETRTARGVAHRLISPGERAREFFAGVEAGDRQSPRAMMTVVADVGSIRPEIVAPLADVQGETLFQIASAPLADRYGNPVPDGTGASVLLSHADGSHSLAFGPALSDRVLAQLIARDIPGPAVAVLTLGMHGSAPISWTIANPRPDGRPPLVITRLPAISALRVTLGPFLTTDGYVLVDGAGITLSVRLADGTILTESAFARDGSVSLVLPLSDPGAVTGVHVRSPLGLLDLSADWRVAGDAP